MKEEKWAHAKMDHRVARLDIHTQEVLEVYESVKDASTKTGVSQCSISKCINNKLRSAGHYMWSKMEDLTNER